MGFTAETFLFIFMPLSIIAFLFVSHFKRDTATNIYLVAVSLFFYWWADKDTFLFFIILIIAAFLMGHLIEAAGEDNKKRKQALAFSAVAAVIVLAYFKYFGAVVTWLNDTAKAGIKIDDIIVPVGISFVIFEAISYFIDIYRGDAKAGSLLETALFLTLYPKLVSGPIVQWKHFSPQVKGREVSLDKIRSGVDRIIIGYVKKAVIADTLGLVVSRINELSGGGMTSAVYWFEALVYMFEIYYDFAGYSDIAIGLCRIFGFDVRENFNFPYTSTSIGEFWRRWHISLGTFFREYIYIPLGGNRKGNVYFHLFVVFLLTGIWHGADLAYVIWGLIHGAVIILERLVRDKAWYKKCPAVLKWAFTMTVVGLGWIFFLCGNMENVGVFFTSMFTSLPAEEVNFSLLYFLSARNIFILVIAAAGALLGRAERVRGFVLKVTETNGGAVLKSVILLTLFIIAVLFIVNSTYSPFIYFKF